MAKMASAILWGGSILVGAALAITLNYWIYDRSLKAPTIITMDSLYYPVYEIPFPSILLCNVNAVYRPSMEIILQKL